jgi:hypothetical protein
VITWIATWAKSRPRCRALYKPTSRQYAWLSQQVPRFGGHQVRGTPYSIRVRGFGGHHTQLGGGVRCGVPGIQVRCPRNPSTVNEALSPSFCRPTQDSLPAAGPALPDGIGYPQGSDERFHICDDSPFPSFLAQGHHTQLWGWRCHYRLSLRERFPIHNVAIPGAKSRLYMSLQENSPKKRSWRTKATNCVHPVPERASTSE